MASKLAVAGVIEGGVLTDEGLAAMSECEDMTTALARELAEGIRHENAVEDIAASFRKMAILHPVQGGPAKQTPEQKNKKAEANSLAPVLSMEQLSLWELAG